MSDQGHAGAAVVEVYWREGCGFCRRLIADLDRHGVEATYHDIWADDAAAATVRSYARGNETVPTVVVHGRNGEAPLGMVNPSIRDVLAAIERF